MKGTSSFEDTFPAMVSCVSVDEPSISVFSDRMLIAMPIRILFSGAD